MSEKSGLYGGGGAGAVSGLFGSEPGWPEDGRDDPVSGAGSTGSLLMSPGYRRPGV